MRRIMIGDVVATAQALARWPETDRRALLDRLITEAHAADRFSRRFCKPHPVWGNGSLLGRALAEPPFPFPEEQNFWACLSLVAATIAERRQAARHVGLGLCRRSRIC